MYLSSGLIALVSLVSWSVENNEALRQSWYLASDDHMHNRPNSMFGSLVHGLKFSP